MKLTMSGKDENTGIWEGNISRDIHVLDNGAMRLNIICDGSPVDILVPHSLAIKVDPKPAKSWRVRVKGKTRDRKRKEGEKTYLTLEVLAQHMICEPPKKKYVVGRKEIHIQPIEVFAHSPEEARQMVVDGVEGDNDIGMEYHSTLDREHWIVEEVDKEGKVLEMFD